jgi:aspartate 1-decarboxylase
MNIVLYLTKDLVTTPEELTEIAELRKSNEVEVKNGSLIKNYKTYKVYTERYSQVLGYKPEITNVENVNEEVVKKPTPFKKWEKNK